MSAPVSRATRRDQLARWDSLSAPERLEILAEAGVSTKDFCYARDLAPEDRAALCPGKPDDHMLLLGFNAPTRLAMYCQRIGGGGGDNQ